MNEQINQYKFIVSDFNSKVRVLKDEKKSLSTVINILQKDNEQQNNQSWNVINSRKTIMGN